MWPSFDLSSAHLATLLSRIKLEGHARTFFLLVEEWFLMHFNVKNKFFLKKYYFNIFSIKKYYTLKQLNLLDNNYKTDNASSAFIYL
jgi:hypothetical protein